MLFEVSWVEKTASEEADARTLKLFSQWQPPAGVEFKGFYDYADGGGGVAIVEAASAEAMLETTAPWATFLRFTIRPLVPIEKATEIRAKTAAWRDSVR